MTKELKRRTEAGRKMTSYNVAAASKIVAGLGVSWSKVCDVPANLNQSDWFHTLTPEQRDAASFSVHFQGPDALLHDLSQSLGRERVSVFDEEIQLHLAPTMTPGQVIIACNEEESPRLLLGREASWLSGCPILQKNSRHLELRERVFFTDLAGNMISTPVLLALLLSTISALSWREGAPAASTIAECIALAESSLALCRRTASKPKSQGVFRLLRRH